VKGSNDLGEGLTRGDERADPGEGVAMPDDDADDAGPAVHDQRAHVALGCEPERTFDDPFDELVAARVERAWVEHDHERRAPGLCVEVPEAEQRELSAELLDHVGQGRGSEEVRWQRRLGTRRARGLVEVGEPPSGAQHGSPPHPASERAEGPTAGGERQHLLHGEEHLRLLIGERDRPLAKIEPNGAAAVERSYHGASRDSERPESMRYCPPLVGRLFGAVSRRRLVDIMARSSEFFLEPATYAQPALVVLAILAACAERPPERQPRPSASFDLDGDLPSSDLAPLPDREPEASQAQLRERPEPGRSQCSLDRRVCAHSFGLEREARQLAELSSEVLLALDALRVPLPRSDRDAGGSPALDVYLDEDAPHPASWIDPGSSAGSASDSATAFVTTPPLGTQCRDRHALAAAIAGAALLGYDGATDVAVLTMLSEHLANLVAPCHDHELEVIDEAQRSPERNFVGRLGEAGPAAFLFPQFLEDRYGTAEPGKLTTALIAISAQRTPRGALVDEPDIFDALRVTQRRNRTSVADTLLEFAVARAFIGARSDELHLADVARFGELGRVRFEWSVDHATLPRRLAPMRPIEPLGATYVLVTFDAILPGAELTFAAEWEQPAAFRWALVKLAADGSELGRFEVTPQLGEFQVQRTVRELAGARYLLVVGIHEGETRRDEPFDPGQVRPMPRSYAVTLYP
jgi:hypothetical protein